MKAAGEIQVKKRYSKKMSDLVSIMENAIETGFAVPNIKTEYLAISRTKLMKGHGRKSWYHAICLIQYSYITAIMEVKSSMGVVAAPTAGSAVAFPVR